MNRFQLIICSVLLSLVASVGWCSVKTNSVSADVVTIKTPKVKRDATKGSSTQIRVRAKNTSEHPISVIAAITPFAKKTQLRLGQDDKFDPVDSIVLRPAEKKTTTCEAFHINLDGLKKDAKDMNHIPITLIFSDGSYLITNAKVDKKTA